jgi:hypothetical protein
LVEVNFEFVEGLIVERAVSHVLVRLETPSLEENVLCIILVEQHTAGKSGVRLECSVKLFLIKRICIFLLINLRTIFAALSKCQKLRVDPILFKF